MSESETISCEICGEPTVYLDTKRCNNCWEVEHRLADYLQSAKGQAYARGQMPLLDDWVDGVPDAWDYEAVLQENEAQIKWCDTVVDCASEEHKVTCDWLKGWNLVWQHGVIFIGNVNETIARKAGALFVSLWLRGVSASFADKLMDGFVVFLERQEQTTFGVRAVVRDRMCACQPYLHFALVFEGNEIDGFIAENKFIREHGLKKGDKVGITIRRLPCNDPK